MTFLDLVKQRYSVRAYDARPVPREALMRAIEAARLAPSASNTQPWHFVVVDEPTVREQVADACRGPAGKFNRFVPQAPTLVVIVQSRGGAKTVVGGLLKRRDYSAYDIGIAAEHFCLQATEDGLGTCILGWFAERRIKRLVAIPRKLRVGLIITVGYPTKMRTPTKRRKSAEEITGWNRFGEAGHAEAT